MLVRILNAMLGLWLFVSAFLWPHTPAQFHNAWLVGLLVTIFAVLTIAGFHRARYIGFALALWLFLSTAFLPRISGGTALNHVLVAVGLVITSLFPTRARVVGRRHATVPA